MNPFHHVSVYVADFERSFAFYEKVLATLGLKVLVKMGKDETGGNYEGAAWGYDQELFFWLGARADANVTGNHVHLAFRAKSAAEVDAFYNAAIAAGAKDNGKPGPRKGLGPATYAAFVHDLDGTNIEATFVTG